MLFVYFFQYTLLTKILNWGDHFRYPLARHIQYFCILIKQLSLNGFEEKGNKKGFSSILVYQNEQSLPESFLLGKTAVQLKKYITSHSQQNCLILLVQTLFIVHFFLNSPLLFAKHKHIPISCSCILSFVCFTNLFFPGSHPEYFICFKPHLSKYYLKHLFRKCSF